ncbi:MAG: hydrogenase formation protein HypD [Pseudomonadales bacterium]|nr:hydrogenase formation protein HypD [Pseudomonadales bacterium]
MKYVDEFRDPDTARKLVQQIQRLTDSIMAKRAEAGYTMPLQLMEFCGGHTHTIFRYGIEQLLPDTIELVHGPGCPVCVLPRGRVDDAVALASRPEVIFTTFGDAMRVPGSQKSLLQAKADGADIRMVYSPLDALKLAKENPEREVIFFALGFETTMPSTALTLLQAERQGITNFSLFCNHITTVPTIDAILGDPDMILDGFLAPGHVSMVIGEEPFQFVAKEFHKPLVITGFEPLDILQSLTMVLLQINEGRTEVENQYKRVVQKQGNSPGQQAIETVFEIRDFFELRGLGSVDHSGVRIRDAYARYDAERKFPLSLTGGGITVTDPAGCQCGDVLKGLIRPWQCTQFGEQCTPQTPMGALMVSSEGACAAYYQYSDVQELKLKRSHQKESVSA